MSYAYLPLTDGGLLSWATNFAAQIAVNPAGLGVSDTDVEAYVLVQTDYANKYAAAINPETRGSATSWG